ncbi:tetratricopeptide repeat protein [Runella slithyformis]|nr:tetratricopeptide repeat protein [Runella slithyformis]
MAKSKTYTVEEFKELWDKVSLRFRKENPSCIDVIARSDSSKNFFVNHLRSFNRINTLLGQSTAGVQGQTVYEAVRTLNNWLKKPKQKDYTDGITLGSNFAKALEAYANGVGLTPPPDDPLPQEVAGMGGGTVQEFSPVENIHIQKTPDQTDKLTAYLRFQAENDKRESKSDWSLERILANTIIDDVHRAEWNKIMETTWKDELGFKLFDDILYGQDSQAKGFAQELSTGTELTIRKLMRNRTDFPYWHRSLVVSALTLSIAQHSDPDKLELLFDFVKEEEPFVWKRALVGIALNSLNRPHLISDNPRFAGFWNKLHTQPYTAEALVAIDNALFDVRQNKEQTLISLYQQWIPQYEYFEKPQHWFLPYYAGNPISKKIPNKLADLLYYSLVWDLSLGKYVFCWQYERLGMPQKWRVPQILENEKQDLQTHPLLIEKYGDDAHISGLYETEINEYVQELHFFYQNYNQQHLQSLFDQQATLLKSSLVKLDTLVLNSAEAHYSIGVAYQNLEQYEKAIVAYQQAIAIKADFHEAYHNMGNAYVDLGQYDQAIDAYQQAIDIKPDFHKAYNFLGNAYVDLGQYVKAIEVYKKAIEIKPDKHEAYNFLGNAYVDLGQYVKAIEVYKKAIE